MGQDTQFRRWMTVRFSNKDQSIYLIPLFEQEYVVQSIEKDVRTSFVHRPDSDFHLSVHESGIVNLTTSEAKGRLKKELTEKKDMRHVLTFQINSTDNLPLATLDELNNPMGGHFNLPFVGLPNAPVMLTVYCVKESANWSPPALGNSVVIHYKTPMRGKDYNFHFVQWQDLKMPKGAGDMAIQYGGADDSFYGV